MAKYHGVEDVVAEDLAAKAIRSGKSQRIRFHRCSAASHRFGGMSANLRTQGKPPARHRRPHSSSVLLATILDWFTNNSIQR